MTMTREEQIQFVNDLTESVKRSIMEHFDEGHIPAEWDGLELRELLAEKFATNAYLKREYPTRYRAYTNHVLVNYL